jgi:adenylylsulfate kinase-like enzyme/glycosyltransferase involved in cell wall biosynthesis
MPHISVVSPVYQAEGCVSELCSQLRHVLSSITESFEIILVEDRSADNSWQKIEQEARADPRIKGLRLARNFGQHRAITAGLDIAQGDWVIVMDCDLQDPPESIPELYRKALEGHDIVIAEFIERPESAIRQAVSSVFWSTLSWLAGINFGRQTNNFRIMSRRVVESFRSYREQLRFLNGITALMGFSPATIRISRRERFAGKSSYSLQKLLRVAIEIMMAYSDKPLKISVAVGAAISALTFLLGIIILILRVAGVISVPGWASVIISMYFITGIIIFNLGIIGFYLGKVFDEAKRRPLYVVQKATFETAGPVLPTAQSNKGRVLWITGLSGAGKSTLSQEVCSRLQAKGVRVVSLDGDELRELFEIQQDSSTTYTRDLRLALARRYAHLCRLLAQQGYTVVIATISLFEEIHEWNREHLPGYFEAYLKVPLDELRRRDPKGIYHRFEQGQLANVAGLDMPIDEPKHADWISDFSRGMGVHELCQELLTAFENRR